VTASLGNTDLSRKGEQRTQLLKGPENRQISLPNVLRVWCFSTSHLCVFSSMFYLQALFSWEQSDCQNQSLWLFDRRLFSGSPTPCHFYPVHTHCYVWINSQGNTQMESCGCFCKVPPVCVVSHAEFLQGNGQKFSQLQEKTS
jgi:hypothetical protein